MKFVLERRAAMMRPDGFTYLNILGWDGKV